MAERIRLRRTKGWRLPEGAVVVSRPTKWGNPFPVARHTVEEHRSSVDCYRAALVAGELAVSVDDVVSELAGRDLACWCPPELACHADALLEMARDGVT